MAERRHLGQRSFQGAVKSAAQPGVHATRFGLSGRDVPQESWRTWALFRTRSAGSFRLEKDLNLGPFFEADGSAVDCAQGEPNLLGDKCWRPESVGSDLGWCRVVVQG